MVTFYEKYGITLEFNGVHKIVVETKPNKDVVFQIWIDMEEAVQLIQEITFHPSDSRGIGWRKSDE